jgi:hypothetical protein
MFPSLDAAMAQYEGFGVPGSVASRNNNPGNIIAGAYATSHGAVGSDGSFATFPDPATGFGAMDSLVGSYANKGASLSDMISAWNGHAANSGAYSTFVGNAAGVDPSASVASMAAPATPNSGTPSGTSGNPLFNALPDLSTLLSGIMFPEATAALNVVKTVTGAGSGSDSFFGISWSRIAAFIIGTGCVIIGLVSFSSGQSVNQTVVNIHDKVKTAGKVIGEDAAIAA